MAPVSLLPFSNIVNNVFLFFLQLNSGCQETCNKNERFMEALPSIILNNWIGGCLLSLLFFRENNFCTGQGGEIISEKVRNCTSKKISVIKYSKHSMIRMPPKDLARGLILVFFNCSSPNSS